MRESRRLIPSLKARAKSNERQRFVRRTFIIAGTALAIAPDLILAQPEKRTIWRIGFLGAGSRASLNGGDDVFLSSMRNLGYVEGKQFVMEWRFADGVEDRLPALATELSRANVDVIVAVTSISVEAARKASPATPVVMTGVGNPVGSGFVSSLAHPGGNVTGISNVSVVVSSKYLELLHEAVPKIRSVAVLINSSHPNHPTVLAQIGATGSAIGVTILPIKLSGTDDIGTAIKTAVRGNAGAIIVPPDPFFNTQIRNIVELATMSNLPTMHGVRTGPMVGGLMSYEPDATEMYARPAAFVVKILKGVKPADLPVEQPARFELIINLKTAKALGITIPQSLLLRADEVIQ